MHGISATFARHRWLALVLVSLLPLWLAGTLERGLWTPDEPREADIVWRMSFQADQALPELGDSKFLEKPPLSYWVAALSLRVLGNSAAAMRAPNLLYAFTTTFAVGLLAFAMAGRTAAFIAALLAGSAFELLRVEIWLAPDACLLAGSAVALLGLYRGYTAGSSRAKLGWYTLMHCGALVGFMSKSAVGWIVPGIALLSLIAWERRWHELLRWQVWCGFTLQLAVIGAWIIAVLREADGLSDLRVLFWNNLAGRFAHIATGSAPNYADAHLNWPGKYLSELPYYLFPWTLLLIPALQRAWTATRPISATRTAWRFAIVSWVPFVALLSCAATARDVYLAPALIGVSVTIALWLGDLSLHLTRLSAWCLRGTRYLSTLLMLIIAAAIVLLAISHSFPLSNTAAYGVGVGVAAPLLGAAGFALYRAAAAQRAARYVSMLAWCYAATVASLTIGVATLSPVINRWQDLSQIALAVQRDVGDARLALLLPDETTIAMMDYYTHRPVIALEGKESAAPRLIADWFYGHSERSRVLVLLPGHASGSLSQWLSRFAPSAQPGDGLIATIEAEHVARIVARYELLQGRRYALLGPVAQHYPSFNRPRGFSWRD